MWVRVCVMSLVYLEILDYAKRSLVLGGASLFRVMDFFCFFVAIMVFAWLVQNTCAEAAVWTWRLV